MRRVLGAQARTSRGVRLLTPGCLHRGQSCAAGVWHSCSDTARWVAALRGAIAASERHAGPAAGPQSSRGAAARRPARAALEGAHDTLCPVLVVAPCASSSPWPGDLMLCRSTNKHPASALHCAPAAFCSAFSIRCSIAPLQRVSTYVNVAKEAVLLSGCALATLWANCWS